MISKFVIARRTDLLRGGYASRDEAVFEILCESNDAEERDDFVRRYTNEPLPAPPPPKPVAPIIEPIAIEDVPFNHASVTAAANAKPKWADIFRPSWLGLSAAEALAGLFAPDDIVLVSSPFLDAVESFDKLSLRLEGFKRICVNPIVAARTRAPIRRQNMVVVFPDPHNLLTQLERAMYLGRLLPLELGVFVPQKMACEFWYDTRSASGEALKKFAHEAVRLGAAANTFSPNFMASIPAATDPIPGPSVSVEMLANVGIERVSGTYPVLFKRQKRQASKSLKKN